MASLDVVPIYLKVIIVVNRYARSQRVYIEIQKGCGLQLKRNVYQRFNVSMCNRLPTGMFLTVIYVTF